MMQAVKILQKDCERPVFEPVPVPANDDPTGRGMEPETALESETVRESETRLQSVCFQSGARVEVRRDQNRISLFSRTGGLVFEYDDTTGRCRVDLPSGDMTVSASGGRMVFSASDGIRFSSGRTLELQSREKVRFAVTDPENRDRSALCLDAAGMSANGDRLDLSARSSRMDLETLRFQGRRFIGTLGEARLTLDRLEITASDIVQKAASLFQSVEDLFQTTAGRIRTLVDGTCHLKTRKLFLKAGEDVKIKGEKIHLG